MAQVVTPTRIAPATVLLAATVAAAAGVGVSRVLAHEIPATATVRAFLKPEGRHLRLLIRVPLESMRDVQFPLRGPGYLELSAVEPYLRDAARMWLAGYVEMRENDAILGEPRIAAARVSLPSDRSFETWDRALAHVTGPPLPDATELVWHQAMLDVLLEYPISAEDSRFSISPGLAHLGLRTTTVLRFLPPGGAERAWQYTGDPGLVRLDPRWHQAALNFAGLGFRHIVAGIDHLLFLLCLVLPLRRLGPLVAIVTAFTVAHSVTLIASALGMVPSALWFPPLIETLIAASIVYMALENILGTKIRRRWVVAFGFGLVHGFGFSFLLRDSLQFAGSHLATALIGFNLGVELGQVAVLLVLVPALLAAFRFAVQERIGIIILSALVAHAAWHWMTERGSSLGQYQFALPPLDAAFLAGLMRALLLAAILAGAVRLLYLLVGRLVRQEGQGAAAEADPSLRSGIT